jgi:hypothetical protein
VNSRRGHSNLTVGLSPLEDRKTGLSLGWPMAVECGERNQELWAHKMYLYKIFINTCTKLSNKPSCIYSRNKIDTLKNKKYFIGIDPYTSMKGTTWHGSARVS